MCAVDIYGTLSGDICFFIVHTYQLVKHKRLDELAKIELLEISADSKSKCKTRLDNLQHLLARRVGLPR